MTKENNIILQFHKKKTFHLEMIHTAGKGRTARVAQAVGSLLHVGKGMTFGGWRRSAFSVAARRHGQITARTSGRRFSESAVLFWQIGHALSGLGWKQIYTKKEKI